jgi:hypothetical protein
MHQCCMQFSYVWILKLIYNLFNRFLPSILAGQTPNYLTEFYHTRGDAHNIPHETLFFAFRLLFYIMIVGSRNGKLTSC